MATISKISKAPRDKTQRMHKGTLFIEGLPETTKTAFKAECVLRNETMRDALIKLMRYYVANHGVEE